MPSGSRCPRKLHRLALSLFVLYKLLGLATFSVNVAKPSRTRKKCPASVVSFAGSRLGIMYNLLLVCLTIGWNYVTLPILLGSKYFHKTIVTTIIELFQGVLGSLVISTTLLSYCANQSLLVRIMNYLIHAEDALRRLHQPPNWNQIFFVLLAVYAIELHLCVAVLVTDYLSFYSDPLSWLSNVVPTMFVGLTFIQYFSVLTLTDAALVNVNAFMQGLHRSCAADDTRLDAFLLNRRILVGSSSASLLVQARDIHDYVCDISSQVSGFYSLPALVGTSFIFIAVLYNTYYLFEPFTLVEEEFAAVILTNTLLWIIFLLYPLGLLTTKITKIVQEKEKTGNIVHVLLNSTIDRASKKELKQFSLQLLHCNVRYTASGYFNLDNTLFQSVLSSVTTYMVILIQFQMGRSASEAKPCNCTR